MSVRFDAAQEYLRRRSVKYPTYDPHNIYSTKPDVCDRCGGERPRVRTQEGRERCWRQAAHVAKSFGMTYPFAGQDVRNAATALKHLPRSEFRCVEQAVERMIGVHKRLHPRESLTGARLLTLIRQAKNESL